MTNRANPRLQYHQWLKREGINPYCRVITKFDGHRMTIDDKSLVNLGSNSYLGLTHHPYVVERAQQALQEFGTGCTGSRFLGGNFEMHEELERRLARFLGREAAIVFSTGMMTNLGALSALCGEKDCILSDEENHASIIDAARLSKGDCFTFQHSDMRHLETLLAEKRDQYEDVYIVSDGVFSMTGSLAPVSKIVQLAKKYQARVYIDDAHGFGVMGSGGHGTVEHFGENQNVDFLMGSFSKVCVSVGGFVAADKDDIDHIRYSARSYMFTASLPPSCVATVMAVLDILEGSDELLGLLWKKVEYMKAGLKEIGVGVGETETAIIPIAIGNELLASQVARFLSDEGVFVTPVMAPAVPYGEAMIRTSYMATHSWEDLDFCLGAFQRMKKEFGDRVKTKK